MLGADAFKATISSSTVTDPFLQQQLQNPIGSMFLGGADI